MGEHPAVAGLQQLGWSEVEARLYLVLHEVGTPQTGYQCAKLADVPRPNAYPALQRLVRRGALLEIPDGDTVRYQAVPFADLQRSLRQAFQDTLHDVETHLAKSAKKPHIAVARGGASLLHQAQALAGTATARIDVGASAGTVAPVRATLAEADARGVQVTYYCFDGCPPPGCGLCRNPIPAVPGPFEMHGWLTLVADGERVVMATDVLGHPEVLTTDLPPLAAALKTLFRRVDAGTTADP